MPAFFAMPLPVIGDIIGASLFCLVRLSARAWLSTQLAELAPAGGTGADGCGLAAALSGLWMSGHYPCPANENDLLRLFRLGFAG